MNRELRAIRVAITCAVIGAVIKATAGAITGSMTMMSSAVDSVGDLMVSVANLFVVRIAAREPDEDHNYGHAKIEGLGAMFEGGFIFAAGGFLVYEAIHKAVIGEVSHDSAVGLIAMAPVLALTIGTVLYLRRAAAATGSLVLRADALHYLTDVYVNIGVVVALALVWLTGRPIIDTVISIGVALYMMAASVRIVREGFGVVMDRALAPDDVAAIAACVRARAEVRSVHDLKTRAGRIPHVDFHVVVDPELTTRAVHDLYLALRADIRARVGASTKVLMHADPEPPATAER